jgi:hypothetical protein
MFTLHPKLVLTARGDSPSDENSLEKLAVKWMRGLSSAITHKVRTQLRLRPRALRETIEVPSPLVQSSMTPYEQKVSLTAKEKTTKYANGNKVTHLSVG